MRRTRAEAEASEERSQLKQHEAAEAERAYKQLIEDEVCNGCFQVRSRDNPRMFADLQFGEATLLKLHQRKYISEHCGDRTPSEQKQELKEMEGEALQKAQTGP